MNTNAPRFVGEFPSNLDETRARLLDFADFLDGLKLAKFNHSRWCRPDHTCKTEACGAGWASILYSESTKTIMDLIYKKQKLWAEVREINSQLLNLDFKSAAYNKLQKRRTKIIKEHARINVDESHVNWQQNGRRVLGIDYDTSTMLFIPGSGYWDKQHEINSRERVSGYDDISSRQFALAIRFLAHTPDCQLVDPKTNEVFTDDLPSFNPRSYKKYIKEHPLSQNPA